jgi:hypothetical protein
VVFSRALFVLVLASSVLASCAQSGSTKIQQPIDVDLGRFETCRIEIAAPFADGKRATSAFLAYLEGRLREEAGLEPIDAPSADILLRIRPSSSAHKPNAVTLAVEVVVVDDEKVVGAFEASGEQEDLSNSPRSEPRGIALQHAADEIASTIKSSRKTAARKPRRELPPTPSLARAEDPFASRSPSARPPVCLSTCELPSSSAIPEREVATLTIRIDPTLQTLRECLHRVGADLVEPAVLLRFGDSGQLVGMRVDVGGYENLMCVSDVWASPPRVRTSRAAIVRCLFHCSTPQPEEP